MADEERGCCGKLVCGVLGIILLILKVIVCFFLLPVFLVLAIIGIIIKIVLCPCKWCCICCRPCAKCLEAIYGWIARIPLRMMRWVCGVGKKGADKDAEAQQAGEQAAMKPDAEYTPLNQNEPIVVQPSAAATPAATAGAAATPSQPPQAEN